MIVKAARLVPYALLLIVLTANAAFGNPTEKEQQRQVSDEPVAVATVAQHTSAKHNSSTASVTLRDAFYQAINLIYAGNHGAAGIALDELKHSARLNGYVNLPDYSVTLLSQAKLAAEEGRAEEVSFLVFHAVELSPEDPRIQLTAASFYKELGVGVALSYALRVLSSIWSYPLLLASFLANLLLVGLIAGTSAFFLTCLIQVVRNGRSIFKTFADVLPRAVRGFVAPVALFAVFIAPLFGGILAAIGCWSLVLAKVKQGCCRLPVLASALMLAWAGALTGLATVGVNLDLRANRVLEEAGNLSFSPEGEQFLKEQLAVNPNDPLLGTVFGQVLQMQGQYNEAANAYEAVLASTEGSSGLNLAARLNMAAISYRRAEYQHAKELLIALEQEGVESFELYYNLALTHLALLDPNNHRAYYLKARARDEARLNFLDEIQNGVPSPVVSGVPTSFYLPLLTRSIAETDPVTFRRMSEKKNNLAASLMRGGSVESFLLVAVIVFLLGLPATRKRKVSTLPLEPGRDVESEQESSIWLFLPAGLMAAGERPVGGVALMTVFLMLLLFALETPMKLYPALPLDVSFKPFLIVGAVVVFVSSAVLSAVLRNRLVAAPE